MIETRPWEEQLAEDRESYRAQIAYLLERSPFYREKLGTEVAGGLDDIAQLPLTSKDELRATRTPENPIGAHLCATRAEIVRIYSTSGTTGTPSYIPLTASDVDYPFPDWIETFMYDIEETLGAAYSEPVADVRGFIASVKGVPA